MILLLVLPADVLGIEIDMPIKNIDECTIRPFNDEPKSSQPPHKGMQNKTIVFLRPIEVEIQPPTKDPIMLPKRWIVTWIKTVLCKKKPDELIA